MFAFLANNLIFQGAFLRSLKMASTLKKKWASLFFKTWKIGLVHFLFLINRFFYFVLRVSENQSYHQIRTHGCRSYLHTGCLTTDMNKVSAFFMEKSPYLIENFDHILFTTDVSFVIMPYLAEKLKGNSKNFHLEKNFKNFWVKIFFQNFLKFVFSL